MSYDMPKDCLELCSFTVDTEKAFAQTDKYGHCLAYLQFYTACASGEKPWENKCMKYVVLKIDCTCVDFKGLNYQYWYMYMLAKIIFQLYRKAIVIYGVFL